MPANDWWAFDVKEKSVQSTPKEEMRNFQVPYMAKTEHTHPTQNGLIQNADFFSKSIGTNC